MTDQSPLGWSTVTIESIAASKKHAVNGGPFGSKLVTTDYRATGVPVIRGSNLTGERFVSNHFVFVSPTKADSLLANNAHPGDIIVTQRGTLGQIAMIPKDADYDRFVISQSQMKLSVDESVALPYFVYYSLRSPGAVATIERLAITSGVPHINLDIFRKLTLCLPPILVQRRIVHILSSYDELLENNSRRIRILEDMARSLHQEWFVHLRFPGHAGTPMVDSAIGRIPGRWRLSALREVASVNASSIRPASAPQTIRYVDIASVSTGRIDRQEVMGFAQAPGRARRLVRHGDTIWSTVRPNRGSYALVLNPPSDLVVSTGFAVLTPRAAPFTYLYCAVTTDDFAAYLVNHARGAAYPAVNACDFENATVLLPPADLLDRFHRCTAELFLLRENLMARNNNLRATRDLLLPRLISGELDVSRLSFPEAGT